MVFRYKDGEKYIWEDKMIKLRLKDISKVVNRYAKVISSIVNIDVEIVDENLIRIAGTGRDGCGDR